MKSSISHNADYPKFCKLAATDNNVFSTFRRNKIYVEVLEHVSTDIAKKYINKTKMHKNSLLHLLPKFKENDLYGSPNKVDFGGEFGLIAPTTIRYISVLHDIYNMFGSFDDKKIVEIGCGYGGQCKLFFDSFNIKNYTLVDLPEPIELIKKYLGKFNIKADYIPYEDLKPIPSFDLVISNYAFSECNKDIQLDYLHKIIRHSKHGFMLCNFVSHVYGLKSLNLNELVLQLKILKKNVHVEEEKPSTFSGNKLIWW